MQQARLIKRGEQGQRKQPSAEVKRDSPQNIVRATVETARAWIRERRASEPTDPRAQFAALFS